MRKFTILFYLVLILLIANIFVFFRTQALGDNGLLTVSFLDIGQGDAIYIKAPNGTDMLIDGGKKDSDILTELGKIMSVTDKEIDIMIATHPDADHIGGLTKVLENYDVKNIVTNGGEKDTGVFKLLSEDIRNENASTTIAERGQRIVLDKDKNVYFDIYWPIKTYKSPDTNDFSIVGKLVYGENEFLLTGDAGKEIENQIMNWCKTCLDADVLKLGHHGSRTSTGKAFLESVTPNFAIISAGLNNSYGHPHKEIISLVESQNIKILETSKSGIITFVSDGVNFWFK